MASNQRNKLPVNIAVKTCCRYS